MNPIRAKQMLMLMQLLQRVDSQSGPPTRNVHFLKLGFSQSVHKSQESGGTSIELRGCVNVEVAVLGFRP